MLGKIEDKVREGTGKAQEAYGRATDSYSDQAEGAARKYAAFQSPVPLRPRRAMPAGCRRQRTERRWRSCDPGPPAARSTAAAPGG